MGSSRLRTYGPEHKRNTIYKRAEVIPWLSSADGAPKYRGGIDNSLFCLTHCSRQIEIVAMDCINNAAILTGGKYGYRSVRTKEGAFRETLYYNAKIDLGSSGGSHLRLGFGRIGVNLDGPIGIDQHGFSWCDTGHIMHDGIKQPFGEPFGPGDTLTCLIRLPQSQVGGRCIAANELCHPRLESSHKVIKNNGLWMTYNLLGDSPATSLNGPASSSIEFFKNGISQGVAFTNLPEDYYYPALSLYGMPRVRVDFRQLNQIFLPPDAKPFSNILRDAVVKESLLDLRHILLDERKKTMAKIPTYHG